MTKRCIFCGSTPTSNEHVFPRWLSAVLAKDPRGLRLPFTHNLKAVSGTVTWEGNRAIEVKAKCVCEACNGGWMSELEGEARPYLEPMIRDQKVVLSAEAQRIVGAWACLKAVVARYAHSPPEPVEREWLDWLYAHHRPPPSWYVWMTSYNGGHPIYYEGHDITVEFPGVDHVRTPHGLLTTIVAGYLALKVLGIRVGSPQSRGRDSLIRIWPPSDISVYWSSENPLDDSTLQKFAAMFLE